eukprot:5427519-Prymnesium_polylepis.1
MVGTFLSDEQQPNLQSSQTPCHENLAQWVADALKLRGLRNRNSSWCIAMLGWAATFSFALS